MNLNDLPEPEEEAALDLNQPPMNLDLDLVIINPIQPIQEGDFLEINDLQNHEEVHYLLQHKGEVYQLKPQEQELMDLADEMHQNEELNLEEGNIVPALQGSPVNFLVDEVPLDQLIGSHDEQGELPEEPLDQENEQALQEEGCEAIPVVGQQAFPEENELFQALITEGEQHLQPQPQNNNIQLGFALTRFEARDPAWSQAMNAEATGLQARFFSLHNTSNIYYSIPSEWANFFTVLLLSLGTTLGQGNFCQRSSLTC